jgi:hypothetical protein
MRIVHISIVAATVALSGCSALKHNVEFEQPTEGPRARVRVVVPAVFNGYRGVRAFPDKNCLPDVNSPGNGNVVASQFGFEANLTGQKLGMPETPLSAKEGTKQAEIFVTAGQPIVFHYKAPAMATEKAGGGFVTVYHCGLPVSFIPEAGVDYELEFVDHVNSCASSLLRLDAPLTRLPAKRVDNCVGRRRSLFQYP